MSGVERTRRIIATSHGILYNMTSEVFLGKMYLNGPLEPEKSARFHIGAHIVKSVQICC